MIFTQTLPAYQLDVFERKLKKNLAQKTLTKHCPYLCATSGCGHVYNTRYESDWTFSTGSDS